MGRRNARDACRRVPSRVFHRASKNASVGCLSRSFPDRRSGRGAGRPRRCGRSPAEACGTRGRLCSKARAWRRRQGEFMRRGWERKYSGSGKCGRSATIRWRPAARPGRRRLSDAGLRRAMRGGRTGVQLRPARRGAIRAPVLAAISLRRPAEGGGSRRLPRDAGRGPGSRRRSRPRRCRAPASRPRRRRPGLAAARHRPRPSTRRCVRA